MTFSVDSWASKGIDVSHWNTLPSLAGLDFAFIKATEGTTVDPSFVSHMKAVDTAGLLAPVYHFNRSDVPVKDQVDALLRTAPHADGYALDVEAEHLPRGLVLPPFTKAQSTEFIDRMHQAGKACMRYSSISLAQDCGQDGDWIAWYTNPPVKPRIPFDIWQFGTYRGVDGNVSPLTVNQLAKLWAGEPTLTDIDVTSTAAVLVDIPAGTPILNPDGSARLTAPTARKGVLSPTGTTSAGGTAMRTIVWTRAAPDPDLLLGVYTNSITIVGPATPATDCSAEVAKATAPLQATIATQTKTIAGLKTDLATASTDAAEAEKKRIADAEAARISAI